MIFFYFTSEMEGAHQSSINTTSETSYIMNGVVRAESSNSGCKPCSSVNTNEYILHPWTISFNREGRYTVNHDQYPEKEDGFGSFRYGQCGRSSQYRPSYNRFTFDGEGRLEVLILTVLPLDEDELQALARGYMRPLRVTAALVSRRDHLQIYGSRLILSTNIEIREAQLYTINLKHRDAFEVEVEIQKEDITIDRSTSAPENQKKNVKIERATEKEDIEGGYHCWRNEPIIEVQAPIPKQTEVPIQGPPPVEIDDESPQPRRRKGRHGKKNHHRRRRARSPSPESATIQP